MVFLAVVNLAQRLTPSGLQGRVSAAVTLAMFGPQAPLQALGSLAILYGTYQQLFAGGAILAAACAAYLAWHVGRTAVVEKQQATHEGTEPPPASSQGETRETDA